ncbi:hypothetical protein FIV37_19770 [Pseudomonas gessardii]|nr:hypothetical protein [Pseudomonas gessardii]
MLAIAPAQSLLLAADPPLSQASQLPHLICGGAKILCPSEIPVGAGLPAIAPAQPTFLAADPPPSQASQLPHLICGGAKILCPSEIPCGSWLARDSGSPVTVAGG